jgi:adenosylhomocysteine nucleosidase
MIALMGAVREEVGFLKRRLGLSCVLRRPPLYVYAGDSRHPDLLLVQMGMGRQRAEEATYLVLDAYPVDALVSFGFAGGLREDVEIGDVILCRDVRCLDASGQEDAAQDSDADLLASASKALETAGVRFRYGRCVSGTSVVSDPTVKRDLGALTQAAIVDMESGWMASCAAKRSVPFLTVRVVSDRLEDPLPPISGGAVDAGWRTRVRIAGQVFGNPRRLRPLIRLARNVQLARKNLEHAMRVCITAWETAKEEGR